jgi:hypothetical protein
MASYFSLDVRRAHEGDCLLLHYGTDSDPGLMLIDGGPAKTYVPHLLPRLNEIRAARNLATNQSLKVDLLMVSHVDDDHIFGILDMTKALIQSKTAQQPTLLKILGMWHNSFDAIIDNDATELLANVTGARSQAAASGGDVLIEDTLEDADFPGGKRPDDHVIEDGLKVLASIEQGFRLNNDANKLGIPINPDFNQDLVIAPAPAGIGDMGKGLSFTVAGPMLPELKALQKKHADWLKELKKKGKSPPAALAAYVDDSIHNLSSLVIHAKVKVGSKSRTMLLTGDARGDKVLKGLELVGLLKTSGKRTMKVDVLKVPHHGSDANVEQDFFDRILAKHYVFSGDGQHGNPERNTLQMLFDARGSDPITIHLTYPIDEIDAGRKATWETEQKKEKKRKLSNPNAREPREDWSPKKHGLVAFFDAHPDFAKQVRIVDATKPHLIELLDPIGF